MLQLSSDTRWGIFDMRSLEIAVPASPLEGPSFTVRQWFVIGFLLCYIAASFVFFFAYVKPSLEGNNDLRIGADSARYLWLAGVGDVSPYVALNGPPAATNLFLSIGNYLGPIIIAAALRSTLIIAFFNYALLFLSFFLLLKAGQIRWTPLLVLLLIHPITFVSLLTLNKEIISMLGTSMLFYYLTRRKPTWRLLAATVLISFLARWEQAALVIFFVFVNRYISKKHRMLVFLVTSLVISVAYVVIASRAVANENLITGHSLNGGLIVFLDQLQLHYLYFLVFWPKAVLNLYAGAINPLAWTRADWLDLYNSAVYLFGSVINLMVTVAFLIRFKQWSLKNDLVHFAMYCALFMSVAPFTNPRYIFPFYIALVFALASSRKAKVDFSHGQQNIVYA